MQAIETIRRAIIEDDAGDAPGSIYGTSARDWAPVAAAACFIVAHETGESVFTEDGAVDLEWCSGIIGETVNGRPGPGELICTYGPALEIDPEDYFEPEEIEDFRSARD